MGSRARLAVSGAHAGRGVTALRDRVVLQGRMNFWPFPGAFVVAFVGACASIELGVRLGRWRAGRDKPLSTGALATALGAHLALFGFILAFTFGMSATRFAERKLLVIDESNAIGTAGLRATVLPEARAARIRRVLADYTELRAIIVPQRKLSIDEALKRNDELTNQLWAETRAAVLEGKPNEPFVTSFAESVNVVIDTGAKRFSVVYRHQIPRLIWGVLAVIGFTCMLLVGFQSGLDKGLRPWVAIPLVISFAVVIMLIADLDALGGLVLKQDAMLDVLRELRAPPPTGP